MAVKALRTWIAQFQYEGAEKPFWFGTVTVPTAAPFHEVQQAVFEAFEKIACPGTPSPTMLACVPGVVIVEPFEIEEEERGRPHPSEY
jgi:hypothetical protein